MYEELAVDFIKLPPRALPSDWTAVTAADVAAMLRQAGGKSTIKADMVPSLFVMNARGAALQGSRVGCYPEARPDVVLDQRQGLVERPAAAPSRN